MREGEKRQGRRLSANLKNKKKRKEEITAALLYG